MRNIGRIDDAASLLRYFESLGVELPFDARGAVGP